MYSGFRLIDGITVTIYDTNDVYSIDAIDSKLYCLLYHQQIESKSLRLNIFKDVDYSNAMFVSGWKIKDNIEWIKNCPLPKDEVFMRYE